MKNLIGMLLFGLCLIIASKAMEWITDPQSREEILQVLEDAGMNFETATE